MRRRCRRKGWPILCVTVFSRRVERGDRAHDTQRAEHREGKPAAAAGRALHGDHIAGQAPGLLAAEQQCLDRPVDLARGIGVGEARIGHDHLDEAVAPLGQQLRRAGKHAESAVSIPGAARLRLRQLPQCRLRQPGVGLMHARDGLIGVLVADRGLGGAVTPVPGDEGPDFVHRQAPDSGRAPRPAVISGRSRISPRAGSCHNASSSSRLDASPTSSATRLVNLARNSSSVSGSSGSPFLVLR